MKNPLHYIHKYPHRTKQILGISYEQFFLLVKQAKERHKERQAEAERQKVRRWRNWRGT